jgi:RpiB/LacA/LacB family sugar-phosphate isomerase
MATKVGGLKIFLGADHAGFRLKEEVKEWLTTQGYAVTDCGALKQEPEDDYPDYGEAVAKKVATTAGAMGILACGSSEGVCVAANKIKKIRAASVFDARQAKKAREHLDANVLCLSGWYVGHEQAIAIVKAWLETPFSSEARHVRRIKKVMALEK